jgi:hypothetical protein
VCVGNVDLKCCPLLMFCVVARTKCYSSVVVVFIAYVVVTWCVWVGRGGYICGYVLIRASKWDYVFLCVCCDVLVVRVTNKAGSSSDDRIY